MYVHCKLLNSVIHYYYCYLINLSLSLYTVVDRKKLTFCNHSVIIFYAVNWHFWSILRCKLRMFPTPVLLVNVASTIKSCAIHHGASDVMYS